jgi:DNA-binding SARP family transcriptional activator
MRFRILGSVAVHDGTRWRELGAAKPRSLLAALLVRTGDVLPVDRLLFELWGDQPPKSAFTQIHGYVLRIRRALGETGARSLVTVAPGYRLIVDAGELDALVFVRLAEQGRAALRAGDTERAAELLGDALALWHGPALADVAPTPLVSGAARRLTELRLTTWEHRVDADLALGRHAEVIDELYRHVDANPLRETFWRQLMVALDRTGRRADAVRAYERLREILVDHSGIEPGAQLRELHDDLSRPAPRQVPQVAKLVGRDGELATLDELAERAASVEPVVATVAGPAGIGKTALVRHWARRAVDRFPDGQLYVDLHGYDTGPSVSPQTVLTRFLHALGVPDDEVPTEEDTLGALYRSRLSGKRVLVVLDNARDAHQVRPLLPGPSSCLVLVTSRDDLRGLTATHGAHLLRLPVLGPAAAVALLGRAGVADDLAELATLCGHLPLALRIAAGKLAARTPVASLVAALREGNHLTELAHRRTAVRAAFDVSYAALPEPARRMFRLIGVVPGPDFSAQTVAALAGLPDATAAAVLDRLAAAHMVEPSGPGRFTCHDLLRRYARDLAGVGSGAERRRLADHYLGTALRAAHFVSPHMARVPGPPVPVPPLALADHDAALAWLDEERANLVAAVGMAPGGWRLVDALRGYFSTRFPREEWAAAAKAGYAMAAAEGSTPGQAAMHLSLGHLAWCDGRLTDALTHYAAARTWSRRAGWREGESTALNGIGRAELSLGRPTEALRTLRYALAIDRTIAFRAGEARELHNIGLAHQSLGRLADAVDHQEQALTLYEELGDRRGRCLVADNLGWVRRLVGEQDEPLDEKSFTRCVDLDWPNAQAESLRALAATHRDAERFADAVGYADRAVTLARAGGEHQVRVDALNVLGDALTGLGQFASASRCYTEALNATSASGFAAGRVDALLGLAGLRLRRGRPAEALTWAEQARAAANSHQLRMLEGRALTVLAEVTASLGRHDEAAQHAEQALATHRDTGHRAGAARAGALLDRIRADGE